MAPSGEGTGRRALALRVLSAVVLAPPVLAAIYFGAPWFDALLAIATVVLAFEWWRLCKGRPAWIASGLLYVGLPVVALAWLRADPIHGRGVMFWLFAVVWAADTGAFAFGRLIGGPRLAPRISPAKTWAGLIGAIVCAAAVGTATSVVVESASAAGAALFSGGVGAVSQGGDLFESWVKRRFHVKDTGTLIPGHGGLLDRVDGLLAAAVATAASALVVGEGGLGWL